MKFADIDIGSKEVLVSSEEELLLMRLRKLAETNAGIIIHIEEFCGILKSGGNAYFQPITEREVLQRGFYGTIYGMRLFVDKKIPPGSYCNENGMLLK